MDTRTYRSWYHMVGRCTKPNHVKYRYYGARGITVDPRWEASYSAFVEDMGLRPQDKTLDRINNALGYSKANCRWATAAEQASNRNKAGISLRKAASSAGIGETTLRRRLASGMSLAEALAPPCGAYRTVVDDFGALVFIKLDN